MSIYFLCLGYVTRLIHVSLLWLVRFVPTYRLSGMAMTYRQGLLKKTSCCYRLGVLWVCCTQATDELLNVTERGTISIDTRTNLVSVAACQ